MVPRHCSCTSCFGEISQTAENRRRKETDYEIWICIFVVFWWDQHLKCLLTADAFLKWHANVWCSYIKCSNHQNSSQWQQQNNRKIKQWQFEVFGFIQCGTVILTWFLQRCCFFSFRITRLGTDRHLQKNSSAIELICTTISCGCEIIPKKKTSCCFFHRVILAFWGKTFMASRHSGEKSIFLIMWFFHPLFGDLNVVIPNVVWRTSSSHQTRTWPSAEELQQAVLSVRKLQRRFVYISIFSPSWSHAVIQPPPGLLTHPCRHVWEARGMAGHKCTSFFNWKKKKSLSSGHDNDSDAKRRGPFTTSEVLSWALHSSGAASIFLCAVPQEKIVNVNNLDLSGHMVDS